MPEQESLTDHAVGVVEHNTTDMQGDVCPENVVLISCSAHANEHPDAVHDALDRAVSEGRLERVDGGYRLPGGEDG